jgi:hypothetical protein
MDIARGGHFKQIPKLYPAKSWYIYGDKTCDDSCQLQEYIYWSLTSLLGAQKSKSRSERFGMSGNSTLQKM